MGYDLVFSPPPGVVLEGNPDLPEDLRDLPWTTDYYDTSAGSLGVIGSNTADMTAVAFAFDAQPENAEEESWRDAFRAYTDHKALQALHAFNREVGWSDRMIKGLMGVDVAADRPELRVQFRVFFGRLYLIDRGVNEATCEVMIGATRWILLCLACALQFPREDRARWHEASYDARPPAVHRLPENLVSDLWRLRYFLGMIQDIARAIKAVGGSAGIG